MAKLIYKKRVIKNAFNNQLNGKVFAKAVCTETLSFEKFIDHVISHGSVYDRGTVHGILYQMVDCMKELLLDSKRLWLGDLGVFYLGLQNKAADDISTFNLADNVVGVKVKFRANMGHTKGLDSKTIRKEAEFIDVETLGKAKTKKKDGSDEGENIDNTDDNTDNTGDDNNQNP